MRRINLRFLLGLVTVAAVLAGATHLLHGHQVRRSAEVLLVQADNRLKAGKRAEAVGFLQRYVKLNPSDTPQRARLAETLAELGQNRQAFFLLERVLREEPARQAERRRLVEVALRIGRYIDARSHLRKHLLKAERDDAVLHDLLGQCEMALGVHARADAAFQRSIELDPSGVEVYLRRAVLLREQMQRSGDAQALLDEMVTNNAENFRAYMARVAYRRQYGVGVAGEDLPSALEQDVQRALELAPDEADVLLEAARVARDARDAARGRRRQASDSERDELAELEESKTAEARRHLERGRKLYPQNHSWYLGLAQLEDDAGEKAKAAAWLRRGLEEVPGHVDLLWNLAERLIQTDRAAEAGAVISTLREKKNPPYPPAPLDYLSARLSIHNKDWREGARQLAGARAGMSAWPELAKQADFWLAHCHGRLGNVDQQLEAYRSALRADPSWAPARLGLASALATIGDVDGAVEEYRRLAVEGKVPLETYPYIARLMFLRRLARDAGQRDWQPVLALLDQTEEERNKQKLPKLPDVPILRAEVKAADEKYDAARSILEEARTEQPEALALRLAEAALEGRLEQWDAAAAELERAEAELGDSADLRIARAGLLVQRLGAESPAQLGPLEESIGAFEAADQARLLSSLAAGYYSLGRGLPAGNAERERALSEARRLWNEAGRLQPDNMTSRLWLFDLALGEGDDQLMVELLKEIDRIEGPETEGGRRKEEGGIRKDIRRIEEQEAGPLWCYGEAARLILLARKSGELALLDQAETLLTEAARRRPGWSRIPLLWTEIDDLREDTEAAIGHYREAVGLGERNPGTIRRLVELLSRRGDYAEADRQLRQLDTQQAPFTVELGRLASEVSARIEAYPRAIDLAEETADQSGDYRDYVWLGQLRRIVKRNELAEKAFRQAIGLAPNEPAPRVALVQFLAGQNRTEEAAAVLDDARRHVAGEALPLVLAECHEAMGEAQQAEQQYRQALQADPASPVALRKLSEFYLRHARPPEAEPLLRQLIDPDGTSADGDRRWARLNLAIVLAARRDYASQQQALALLDENLKLKKNSVDDRRAKAVVLATRRQRRPLRQAIELLEELVQVGAPSSADRFLLAQLYQAEGNWPAARRQMQSLLAAKSDNPSHVAWYVRALVARNEAGQAEAWLEQLVRLEPDSARTAELRARWLVARGNYEEAIGVLDALLAAQGGQAENGPGTEVGQFEETGPPQPTRGGAAQPPAQAAKGLTAGAVAGLLEQLAQTVKRAAGQELTAQQMAGKEKLLAAAEQRYREQAGADPTRFVQLAGFLGRQGRIDEALEVYEPGWHGEAAEQVAIGAAALMRSKTAARRHLERVEARLRELVEQKPDSVAFLVAAANLHDLKGDYAGAERAWRKIIALEPKHVAALNNLALLTSYGKQGRSESLALINRAIAAAGPQPVLLDSRASVHLALGKPGEAIDDLKEALADEPSGTTQFRLAQAQQMAGNRAAAAAALKQARQQGFDPSELHPLELKGYQKLEKELAGQ